MTQGHRSSISSNIDLSANFPLSIPLGRSTPDRDTSKEQHSLLKQRFADIYDCRPEQVLLVSGLVTACALLIRATLQDGEGGILALQPERSPVKDAAQKLGLETRGIEISPTPKDQLIYRPRPGYQSEMTTGKKPFLRLAGDNPQAIIAIDESCIEFCQGESLVADIDELENLAIIRSPDACYGTRALQITVLIANEKLITRLAKLQPQPTLPPVITEAALKILNPLNMPLHLARIRELISERERLAVALPTSPLVQDVIVANTYNIVIKANDASTLRDALRLCGIKVNDITTEIEDCFRITIGTPQQNNALLEALGADTRVEKPARIGECIRNTNETQISIRVDLDNSAPVTIDTGIGFFDHMLEQIARHGDFSLVISASGDLEIDAHHTVEDCALALGTALKSALGDRAGIGRYGFSLPMDESSATAMIDLSGRPATRFEAEFPVEQVGELQTQMISHFFESLAMTLGAAIHIEAQGENAHHMIEAIFKSVGRALRPAFAREGDAIPSTKGVL